jgi:hypothetical protein
MAKTPHANAVKLLVHYNSRKPWMANHSMNSLPSQVNSLDFIMSPL